MTERCEHSDRDRLTGHVDPNRNRHRANQRPDPGPSTTKSMLAAEKIPSATHDDDLRATRGMRRGSALRWCIPSGSSRNARPPIAVVSASRLPAESPAQNLGAIPQDTRGV
jgi:hypothetical protein